MFKLLKLILSLAVVLAIVGGGVVVYRLWDQGELKKENFTTETMGQLLKEQAEQLGSDVKEGSLALKHKIQHEWVDWEELKGNWTLSEDEFEAFKRDSLAFLSMDDGEEGMEPEELTKQDEPPVKTEEPVKSKPEAVATPKTTKKPEPVVVKKSPPPVPRKPTSRYPKLDESKAFAQGMAELEKAKEYNRKGLPGKPNAKSNLKKAVSYYRKAQKKIAEASRTPGLNAKETARLEKLQEEIGKQIYWGSKLGTL